MSDTPITDALIRDNALAIFDHARQQEKRIANLQSIIDHMTTNQESLTDEEILGICESHDPSSLAKYIKFLIGICHKDKSKITELSLKLELTEINSDG